MFENAPAREEILVCFYHDVWEKVYYENFFLVQGILKNHFFEKKTTLDNAVLRSSVFFSKALSHKKMSHLF